MSKEQSKMDNPGKLATQGIQDEKKKKNTHNMACVGHHYTPSKHK